MIQKSWLLKSILRASIVFIFAATAFADVDTQSVGKLRSGAEMAFANGENDKALKLWEQVISIEPNNDHNYYKRFRVYLRQQRLKEALADLNAALRINPNNENALVQRSRLQLRLGKCAEANYDFDTLKKYVTDTVVL